MKLAAIAETLGGTVSGDADLDVTRLVHPADARGPGDLAVAVTKDAFADLGPPAVAAVVKADKTPPAGISAILFGGHERMALAILTRLFDPGPVHTKGIDARAAIAPDAEIGAGVSIGPFATVGPGSRIGANTIILPGAHIGGGVTIGRDCVIHPGARIDDRVVIGDRVCIYANAVIGSAGFGVIPVRNPDGSMNPIDAPVVVHSVGTVVIADDVEVGAATTIDRGTLRDTRVGRGTKIDNQVQIGHNAIVGECCVICGLAGIGGSVELGDRAVIGAAAGISDHVKIGAEATVMGFSAVGSRVAAGQVVGGLPAAPRDVALERILNVARLKSLYPRVDTLESRIDALEKDGKAR